MEKLQKSIEKEILTYSYWEHFKANRDLALTLPPEHPKRIALEKEFNSIRVKLDAIESTDKTV